MYNRVEEAPPRGPAWSRPSKRFSPAASFTPRPLALALALLHENRIGDRCAQEGVLRGGLGGTQSQESQATSEEQGAGRGGAGRSFRPVRRQRGCTSAR